MASVELSPTGIAVRLLWWEKLAALHGDVTVPWSSVGSAGPADRSDAQERSSRRTYPWWAYLGLRVGTGVPGLLIAGRFGVRRPTFVYWRRGQEPLEIRLTGQRWGRLVIGVDDAKAWARRINDH